MKKENDSETRQCFPLKFSKLVIGLSIAVLVLCVAGITLSVYQLVRFGIHEFNDALKYPVLIALSVFLMVLVIAILARSQYVVDDLHLTTQFGFVKSKYVIRDITAIVLNSDSKKLTVYFGEQYIVITVSPDWNETLVRALLAVNSGIDYSFTLSDPPKNSENDKK